LADVVTNVTPVQLIQNYAVPGNTVDAPIGQLELQVTDVTIPAPGVGNRAAISCIALLPAQFAYTLAECTAHIRMPGTTFIWPSSWIQLSYSQSSQAIRKNMLGQTVAFNVGAITGSSATGCVSTLQIPPKGIVRADGQVQFTHSWVQNAEGSLVEAFYRLQALFYVWDRRAGESLFNTRPILMR